MTLIPPLLCVYLVISTKGYKPFNSCINIFSFLKLLIQVLLPFTINFVFQSFNLFSGLCPTHFVSSLHVLCRPITTNRPLLFLSQPSWLPALLTRSTISFPVDLFPPPTQLSIMSSTLVLVQ